jgi:hypothetical protein
MKETILWLARTALDITSTVFFIVSLCALDSEALWIPVVGILATTAWLTYRLWKLEKANMKDGEIYDKD